jgi:hypothetical protein
MSSSEAALSTGEMLLPISNTADLQVFRMKAYMSPLRLLGLDYISLQNIRPGIKFWSFAVLKI